MGSSEELRNTTAISGNNTATSTTVNSNHHTNSASSIKSIKLQRGGISESSTTSDNTTDFIEIVKKHDIVYNTHHPDYKNVEVKLKVWTQIAEEIGLSVDASKRKWKNLRDSYTKYLRSFRVGTKTSKKYQFWAHAEHMDFLKPYQGPGRTSTNVSMPKEEEDNECDLGFQVLSKAQDEDEQKQNAAGNNNAAKNAAPSNATAVPNMMPNYTNSAGGGIKNANINLTMASGGGGAAATVSSAPVAGTIMLPVPSLPTVQLPPSLTAKPILASLPPSSSSTSASSSSVVTTINNTPHSFSTAASLASLTATSVASQVFSLPQLSAKGPIPMPSSNTASSVGCLIIEPQLFASADTFKKEFNSNSSSYSSTSAAQITSSGLQIYPNISGHVPATSQPIANRLNPPLITKIRRVQPSPQSSAINLSFSTNPCTTAPSSSSTLSTYQSNGYPTYSNSFIPTLGGSTTITATSTASNNNNGGTIMAQPPAKKPKTTEVDISAILQANRDLDANTLFFLSLARSVRSMPTKFQSLAKMRCMRIVSDIELELDNINNEVNNTLNTKYCTNDNDTPPTAAANSVSETTTTSEHFVYVMSPSRVESMIDLSSDEESPSNNGN